MTELRRQHRLQAKLHIRRFFFLAFWAFTAVFAGKHAAADTLPQAKSPPTEPAIAPNPPTPVAEPTSDAWTQSGEASYYSRSRIFRRTASGERFDDRAMTAAHLTLPLGTRVKVTNLANGRSVVVTINDRPAQTNPRVIDLARGAAARLGMMGAGLANVQLSLATDQDEAEDADEVAEAPEDLDPPIVSRPRGRAYSLHVRARATRHVISRSLALAAAQ